jgi:KaiC/GvpD/RAD55 family RecA-like ATPase
MPDTLRFGIESLDKLIGTNGKQSGMNIAHNKGDSSTTSMCIIGPDGTGKSVLVLHLAAQYLADCMEGGKLPKVLYISTDLTHNMAETIWRNFDLCHPRTRIEPFTTK